MKLVPKEAAERSRTSVELIYKLCREGRLPHYRVGGSGRRGKILIDSEDLDALLTACRVEGPAADAGEGPLKHIR